jgi:hypothetical protein
MPKKRLWLFSFVKVNFIRVLDTSHELITISYTNSNV